MLYLYYLGIVTTALYTLWCVFVWLMLGSRLTEGWWSRLTRYACQLWAMGLCAVRTGGGPAGYCLWWWRQESAWLLRWCAYLQTANTCVLFSVASLALLSGAVGCYDIRSFEGW
jgi:hypothetical protein